MADQGLSTTVVPPVRPGLLGEPEPASAVVAPVEKSRRIATLDVLRGFALLGILPVNIGTGFALHSAAMFNPTVAGGFEGWNRIAWWVMHLGFEFKMMTIFAMLFGAGMMAMDERLRASSGPRSTWIALYYRRLGFLALFGLVHAYGLWFGDILFTYALCALVLYPARKLSPGALFGIALTLIVVGIIISAGLGGVLTLFKHHQPADYQREMASQFAPSAQMIAEEVSARGSDVGGLYLWNAGHAVLMHLFLFPLFSVWRLVGCMFLGAALLKWGILKGDRSARYYLLAALIGYAVGLPIQIAGAVDAIGSNFDAARVYLVWFSASQIGSLFLAAAHAALVIFLFKSGVLTALWSLLARVGRIAFTNYIMQTIICMFLFSALGLGLFNTLDRVQLWAITIAIWIAQITFSVLWLNRFDIGPLEWLWRSLTYMKRQPWRRAHEPRL